MVRYKTTKICGVPVYFPVDLKWVENCVKVPVKRDPKYNICGKYNYWSIVKFDNDFNANQFAEKYIKDPIIEAKVLCDGLVLVMMHGMPKMESLKIVSEDELFNTLGTMCITEITEKGNVLNIYRVIPFEEPCSCVAMELSICNQYTSEYNAGLTVKPCFDIFNIGSYDTKKYITIGKHAEDIYEESKKFVMHPYQDVTNKVYVTPKYIYRAKDTSIQMFDSSIELLGLNEEEQRIKLVNNQFGELMK